ncbi:MAG TPA: MaoC/PaaZ C-terminal domain-containing protein [Natronosporangium sp.]|nr:MaoC/PaaZ C-terminal domain-containing protein [Natronosporangium sp.]
MTGSTGHPARSGTGGEATLFWEDLTPGRAFDLGVTRVDRAEMVAFARRYDPQWYHVDERLAAESEFGGLIASGFFTVSLFMRAYVDGLLSRAAAAASPGLEELRWLAPVRAGDALAVRAEVVASARSRARPDCGTVTLRGTMARIAPDVADLARAATADLAPAAADVAPEPVLRVQFRGWFRRRPPTA